MTRTNLAPRYQTSVVFLLGGILLAAVVLVIGPKEMLSTALAADLSLAAIAVVAALFWLCCWGVALHQLAAAVGVQIGITAAILVTAVGTAINHVSVTDGPITAYLLAWQTNSSYEHALAGIAALKTINLFPTAGMALIGFLTLLDQLNTVNQELLAVFVIGFPVTILVLIFGVWKFRSGLTAGAITYLPGVLIAVSRVVPRWSPTRSTLRTRVRGFAASMGQVASDRRRLGRALGAATLGWLAVAVSLFFSLRAVGADVSFALPLLAVPIGTTASATVLPGGLGGAEALLTAVLTRSNDTPVTVIGAAVLIYRGATYWLPILLGGIAFLVLVIGGGSSNQAIEERCREPHNGN